MHRIRGLVKNMKKNLTRMLALCLALALLPAMALADRFAVVKGGRLNLRQYPTTDSYSLGKYDTGTWVLAGNEHNGWYEVKTLNGKRGYMSSAYLDFGTSGSGSTTTVKYASGNYVNLRSGPSTDAAVVMRVPSGSTFHMQGNYGGWCYGHVNVGSQTVYGYMYETFLGSSSSTAVVTTRNGGKVNIRSGPSSSYSSMGKLASGTQVTVLLKGNGWYKVSGGGYEGYMSTQYLSGTGFTLGNNTGATTSATTAWVNNPKATQVLNLRETPSQSARSIGQYRNGTKVKVVSRGATWCEVYVGTRHGYMMTRYLSFDGNYVKPSYPDYSYPNYNYPIYTQPPYFATQPPYYVPTVTPTPTPLVQYITPKPQQTGPAAPKAGDTVTLAIAAGGSSNLITVYHDASLTQAKASYAHGKQVMMLQYGTNSCMIYVDGGVAYVPMWNVNY